MLKKLKTLLDNEADPAFAKRAEFIFKVIEREKPEKILDVGCGRGFYIKSAALYGFIREIHGIDKNERYLAQAKEGVLDKRINLQTGSAYGLPYKANYFDLVICSEVLEHLTYDARALREILRVLSPGGTLIVSVPSRNFPFLWDPINWTLMRFFNTHINKNIWWLAGMWADHLRLYSMGELTRKIEKVHLSVRQTSCVVHFCWPFSHLMLYGIGKNIVERLSVKSFSRFDFKPSMFRFLIAGFMRLPIFIPINTGDVDNIVVAVKPTAS